ncbi:hypothetical protein LCGC14_1163770 [marine sediment metagenome]|uniref:Methyltransferase domain-containing protein n=1 Tax=marine sediment metagenome TaxID=412755 RepID=A0A0F9LWX2_9ZZZZ
MPSPPEVVEDRIAMLEERLPHHAVCAEVGVFDGTFSRFIYEVTQPARLHLIDIWADISYEGEWCTNDGNALKNLATVSTMFREPIKQGRVMLHQGRSAYLLSLFPDRYFDWVYVDADHSYQGVARDLLEAEAKIKPGGFLAGHDYATEEQGANLRHYYPGVINAVNDFCQKRGWKVICISKQGEYSGEDIGGRHVPSYILSRV